ncbi:MAG: hypothetical protein OXQ29_08800 [Rhodospirillaceae bacterium]|nr:hypothetical protein [Rhodospirillaceae bacterium]
MANDAFALRAEMRRLRKLLDYAGVESGRYSVTGLRREIVRLRGEAPRAEAQARKIRKLHKDNWQPRVDRAALRRFLYDALRDYDETQRLHDQAERVRALKDETLDLRWALKLSEAVRERLRVRLVCAVDTARSMSLAVADAELRRELGCSRRRKAAMTRLSKENARLRRKVQRLRHRGPGCRRRRSRSCARAARCCPRRCKGAGARCASGRALDGRAARSAALPDTAEPRGPRLRNASRSTARRRRRAGAAVAGSPTRRSARSARRCSRSR